MKISDPNKNTKDATVAKRYASASPNNSSKQGLQRQAKPDSHKSRGSQRQSQYEDIKYDPSWAQTQTFWACPQRPSLETAVDVCLCPSLTPPTSLGLGSSDQKSWAPVLAS